MTTREQIIRYAERALDRALDHAAIAGAAIRFAQSGEIELAQRARRILEADAAGSRRRNQPRRPRQ